MSTRLYTRKAAILAEVEVNEGVDPTPSASTNAMLVSELSINPLEVQEVDLSYIRSFYGISPSVIVSENASCSFTVDIAGSSAAGTAPPWGALLKACAFTESVTGSAVTGTAQTGAASSITLASGASSTTNAFVGMTIAHTGGTDFGDDRVIVAYNGTTKVATVNEAWSGTTPDATSTYSIGKNVRYLPTTDTIDSLTIYYYQSGVLHKMTGCRGNVSFDMSANARPAMKFTFTGVYNAVIDAAVPTATYTAWQSPTPILTDNTTGLLAGKTIDGSATGLQLQKWTLDMGNQVKYRQLVGAANVVLTDRQPKGSVSIEMTDVSTKDWFADIRNGVQSEFMIQTGTTAAKTICFYLPKCQLAAPKYSDSDGIVMLDAEQRAMPNLGNDEVVICVK